MRLVFALSLAACGGHTSSPAPLSNHVEPKAGPQLQGFAHADLVTFEGKSVVAYSIAGGRLAKLGALEVGADGLPFLSGDWADRDHLFVQVADRDVVMLTPAGLSHVTVPDAAKFKTPKPKPDDDQLVEGGNDGDALRIAEGSAWWVECAWGYPYDGFQCEQWVSEQLWPEHTHTDQGDPVTPRSWSWQAETPGGVSLNIDGGKLVCASGATKATFAGNTEPEQIDTYHWVTTNRLLVVYGEYGLDSMIPTRWELHDGCTQASLAEGAAVEPGPDGLWLATGTGDAPTYTLRRGDQVIGELPTNAVRFRPTE